MLKVLDNAIQDYKPRRLNAPAVTLALESAVDRVLGRAGAGREASAKGHDFLARVALLTEALTGAPATRPAPPTPPPAAHTPKPPAAAAAPAQPAAAAWPILERYEILLRTNPRAAGTYYSENADAIAAQTSARNVEFRRQSNQKRR